MQSLIITIRIDQDGLLFKKKNNLLTYDKSVQWMPGKDNFQSISSSNGTSTRLPFLHRADLFSQTYLSQIVLKFNWI